MFFFSNLIHSEPLPQPQQTLKPVPVGYFRTFTYQPLAFQPQPANPYFSYQGAAKMIQPNPLFNWAAKPTYPYGPMTTITGMPSSMYGTVQPQSHQQFHQSAQVPHQFSQLLSTSPSLSTAQSQTQPQVTNSPTYAAQAASPVASQPPPPPAPPAPQVQTSAPLQPQSQISSSSSSSASSSSTSNVSPITVVDPPLSSEMNLPSTAPAAQFYNGNNNGGNGGGGNSLRQLQYVPDMQYFTNVAPVPLPVQPVQFVPCMCPVSMGVQQPELIANKRTDDTNPMQFEYREMVPPYLQQQQQFSNNNNNNIETISSYASNAGASATAASSSSSTAPLSSVSLQTNEEQH